MATHCALLYWKSTCSRSGPSRIEPQEEVAKGFTRAFRVVDAPDAERTSAAACRHHLAGGLCGLAAVAFHLCIGWAEALFIDRANHAPGYSWIWWTILTPALGGLIVGLGLTYLGSRSGRKRDSAGQGGLCAAIGPGFSARNHRQIRSLYAFRSAPAPRSALRARPCRFVPASAACWRARRA